MAGESAHASRLARREIAFLHGPPHTAMAAKLGRVAVPPRTRDSRARPMSF